MPAYRSDSLATRARRPGTAMVALHNDEDESFLELDQADAPLLNVDLYEARMFIRGHRQRILAAAFTAAKRIAKQHGAAALRHEAYQRQALRQGFMGVYLQVNPAPVHHGKAAADQYRRELIAVARRAEDELMQLLGSLKGMVLRLARSTITKGLFESEWEGDSQDRRSPKFKRTAAVHRAKTSKRTYTLQRAAARQRTLPQRPSQRQISSYMIHFSGLPRGWALRPSVLELLATHVWRQWYSFTPMFVSIGTALAKSATGNPAPAVVGNVLAEFMIHQGLIGQNERAFWSSFLAGLWSAPIPRLTLLAMFAGMITLAKGLKAAKRNAAFEHGAIESEAEAEALAAFEMAAA
ncbi:MAG: hypothetical protein NWP98_09795 [Erythrobacter sp.]|nr:hypothetical protein [Erythrobacter sp.]